MFGIGAQEIVLLVGLGILVFGVAHLPRLGRSLGRTASEFKKGVSGIEDDVESCVNPAKTRPDPEPVRPPQRVLPAPRA